MDQKKEEKVKFTKYLDFNIEYLKKKPLFIFFNLSVNSHIYILQLVIIFSTDKLFLF